LKIFGYADVKDNMTDIYWEIMSIKSDIENGIDINYEKYLKFMDDNKLIINNFEKFISLLFLSS